MFMVLQAISVAAQGAVADRLLVLLHGWGANAQDVAGLATYLNLTGFEMLFPQGPFPHPMQPGGRMWYSLPLNLEFGQAHDFGQQADLQESRRQLLSWLQQLPETSGIPLEKTILGGFSQGGAMVLDVGLQLPLAGMVILSGYCHRPVRPSVSDRPILMIHGQQDAVVPLQQARQAKAQLSQQKLMIDYHEFEMGHEVSLPALAVVSQFCQRLGTV